MSVTVDDVIRPAYWARLTGKQAGMWGYEILNKRGELHMAGCHRGNRQETELHVEAALGRLNGDDTTSVWTAPCGLRHNTSRARMRRARAAYQPGTVLNTVTIVSVAEMQTVAKNVKYVVKKHCCGDEGVLTGQAIYDREKRHKAGFEVMCHACRYEVSA